MKILFHINSMGRGGAEHVVSVLSHTFIQRGYEVILTTQWRSEDEYETDEQVRRIHVGLTDKDINHGRLYNAWLRFVRLRKCIRAEKPDLVISFCNKANFRSAFAMFGMKTPLIISVRNDPQVDYAPYKIPTWYMENKASGGVFQTPDAMRFFSKKFQQKSCIIFNPLSEKYLNSEDKVSHSLIRDNEIVTVGRISRQKNQLLLLRAFQIIAQKYPAYILKIYGVVEEQDCYEELQRYIDSAGLENKVFFMGVTDILHEEIQNAAVFVLTSDYEGMPNALIEAMALGLPCIATDCPCGGSALLVQNEISGILVPTGQVEPLWQALDYMLSNPEKAEAMGQNAKKILAKVQPDKICDEWIKYISEITIS
ncbi:MAG: glycosyltransferase [Clostridiales bacterium]|nr:glycosyltransferase [Clostridiales bacterium]